MQSVLIACFEYAGVICVVLQQEFHAVFWRIYMRFICHWCIGFVGTIVYLQVIACTTGCRQ